MMFQSKSFQSASTSTMWSWPRWFRKSWETACTHLGTSTFKGIFHIIQHTCKKIASFFLRFLEVGSIPESDQSVYFCSTDSLVLLQILKCDPTTFVDASKDQEYILANFDKPWVKRKYVLFVKFQLRFLTPEIGKISEILFCQQERVCPKISLLQV